MCSGVCSRRCAMRAVAGEFGDETKAAACFKGARRRASDVVLARSACKGRALRESASTDDLSERYGQPYAERGHACVWCVVLCVALRVPGGHHIRLITCCDDRPLPALLGRRKVDSYYTHFSCRFLGYLPPQRVPITPVDLAARTMTYTNRHRYQRPTTMIC